MTGDRELVFRCLALFLGAANAAVTAYWLVGGTALLDTVGGEIERWGRDRTPAVIVVLAVVLLVKLAVAVIPLVVRRLGDVRLRRWWRLAGWAAAATLIAYGGLLTVVGLLVQTDVIARPPGADDTALAWHAFFWDPWFLVWGAALAVWLNLTRDPR